MKRALYLTLILIICSFLIAGCWSRRELDDLSIAYALGFDYVDNEHVVTVQIINPGQISPAREGESGSQAPVATYTARGATVFEAVRRLTKVVPRKVYLSYVRIVVIGEALAKRGMRNVLDFLLREDEFRTDFYLLVAKDSPTKDMLHVLTLLNPIPAEKVYDSLEISKKHWAATGKITIDELITDLAEEGRHPVLTGLTIVGNKDAATSQENVAKIAHEADLKLTDMAAFRGDKLAGWLDENESKGYNYAHGKVQDTITTIPCPGHSGTMGVEMLHVKGTVSTSVSRGRPRGRVTVEMVGNIGDVECGIDLKGQHTMKTIEKQTEEKVREHIVNTLQKAQKELRTDIFGFGERLHHSHPHTWHALKKEWEQTFVDLPVDVEVDVAVRTQGSMTKSLGEIMREVR